MAVIAGAESPKPKSAGGKAYLFICVFLGDEVGEGDALARAEGHGAIVRNVGALKGHQDVALTQHRT